MIAVPDPEEPAERHDRIGDLPALLVEHEVIDRPHAVASRIEDVRALHFTGGDKGGCFLDGVHGVAPWLVSGVQRHPSRKVPAGVRTVRRWAPSSATRLVSRAIETASAT